MKKYIFVLISTFFLSSAYSMKPGSNDEVVDKAKQEKKVQKAAEALEYLKYMEWGSPCGANRMDPFSPKDEKHVNTNYQNDNYGFHWERR